MMYQKSNISILLRGAPASGKSTICEEIQKRNPHIVWLHVDSFKRFVNSGNEKEDRNHWYGGAAASFEYFLKNNFNVIVEGIFQNTEHINLFLDIAGKNHKQIKIFELRTSLEELISRDKTRRGVAEGLRPALSEKTIGTLHAQVINNPVQNINVIDTGSVSQGEIVNRIEKELDE